MALNGVRCALEKELGVALDVCLVGLGHAVDLIDCFDWAFWKASPTVDALIRVDKELRLWKHSGTVGNWHRTNLLQRNQAVDALRGAHIHASSIAGANTGICNYIGHVEQYSNSRATHK